MLVYAVGDIRRGLNGGFQETLLRRIGLGVESVAGIELCDLLEQRKQLRADIGGKNSHLHRLAIADAHGGLHRSVVESGGRRSERGQIAQTRNCHGRRLVLITAENITQLFDKYHVPYDLDLLSIDIDYNDFYVWKALDEKYQPAVVVIEYNATHFPSEDKVAKYHPYFAGDGTNYYGAGNSQNSQQRVWVAAHWKQTPNGQIWIEGYWKRNT